MIYLAKENNLLMTATELLIHEERKKLLVYQKGSLLFAFNFHPCESCTVTLPAGMSPDTNLILHTEWMEFGGQLKHQDTKQAYTDSAHPAPKVIQLGSRNAAVYRI